MVKTERRSDLDAARALAMMGVVAVHVTTYFRGYGLDHLNVEVIGPVVWGIAHAYVLPVFMLAAGASTGLSRQAHQTLSEYKRYEIKKFQRIMFPFFAVAALTLAIKAVMPGRGLEEVQRIWIGSFIAPRAGASPHLWFLYCLMCMFLVWPFVYRLLKYVKLPVVILAMTVVAILPLPYPTFREKYVVMAMSDTVWLLPFFLMGYWYIRHPFSQRRYGMGAVMVALAVVAAATLLRWLSPWPVGLSWTTTFRAAVTDEVLGAVPNAYLWATAESALRMISLTAAAFGVLWLSGIIVENTRRVRDGLVKVGLFSYDVYLLHVAFVAHPLALIASKLSPGLVLTYVLYVLILVAAVIVPMLMGMFIRRFPPVAFVVLGVPLPKKQAPSTSQLPSYG